MLPALDQVIDETFVSLNLDPLLESGTIGRWLESVPLRVNGICTRCSVAEIEALILGQLAVQRGSASQFYFYFFLPRLHLAFAHPTVCDDFTGCISLLSQLGYFRLDGVFFLGESGGLRVF